jgi:membrane protein
MSNTELHTKLGQSEYAPIWAVALAGTLLAASFGRRRAENAAIRTHDKTPRAADSTQLDDGRGRMADAPSQIPVKGWKDILLRVYRGIAEDRILLIAASVTFYLLLSIFPGLAALFSVYGIFADPAEFARHLDGLANIAPGGAMDVLRDKMTRLASKGGTALGIGFIVGLAVSLWTAKSGISTIFDSLNIVYHEKEARGTFKLYLATLTFTFASIVFILLAIAIVVLLPVALNFISLPGGTDLLVKLARWPILFVLAALALACSIGTGRAVPAHTGAGSPGAVDLRHYCGLPLRCCSRGTSRISAAMTRPTGPWARSSGF